MERLVGVRGGELHHDALASGRKLPEGSIGGKFSKSLIPVYGRERQVQEALDAVVCSDFRRMCLQIRPDGVSCGLRGGMGDFQKREHHQRVVPFKLFAGNRNLK